MHELGAGRGTGARTLETGTTLAVSSLFDFMTTKSLLVVSTGLLLTMNNVSIMIITTFTMVETVFSENMFCSIKMWFDGFLINRKRYRMCIFNVCLVNEQVT